jgi:hypothetical protein
MVALRGQEGESSYKRVDRERWMGRKNECRLSSKTCREPSSYKLTQVHIRVRKPPELQPMTMTRSERKWPLLGANCCSVKMILAKRSRQKKGPVRTVLLFFMQAR